MRSSLARLPRAGSPRAFTVMQALVAVALVIVLVAIIVPAIFVLRARAHQQIALEKIRMLCGALQTYAAGHGGWLPLEDADGEDTWRVVAGPESKDAWYNALPI